MRTDGLYGEVPEETSSTRVITLGGIPRRQWAVIETLSTAGAIVEEMPDVASMLRRLHEEPRPDLVVLEWNMAGIEALSSVRSSGGQAAVLVLGGTAGSDSESGLSGHRPGDLPPARRADLGLGKGGRSPLVPWPELLRPGAPSRALEPVAPPALRAQVVRLDRERHRAFWSGRRVDLSLTEFRIVSRLAGSPGVDFSHRDIYDIIKGEGVISGRGEQGYRANVRAAIKRIRQKFYRLDPGFCAIRNYHGFGYHWDEAAAPGPAENQAEY